MDFLASVLRMTFMFFIFRTIIMLISSRSMSKRMKDKMKNSQVGNTDSGTNNPGAQNVQGPAVTAIEMVKDQLCGTFVPKNQAYIVRTSGENHYFCSWECRENFAQKTGN